jgi:hypothetical protein
LQQSDSHRLPVTISTPTDHGTKSSSNPIVPAAKHKMHRTASI